MVSPNLGIGQLVLIIIGRLWCGRRMKMIIGMVWDFGEEVLAIRDAMEEEYQFFARQKSKGKRELLNLHSSINYGDANYPSRRRKGKAHML
jgi:hypothetical protein